MIVARFRDHREKIHNGPFYTVLAKKREMEDPFEDGTQSSVFLILFFFNKQITSLEIFTDKNLGSCDVLQTLQENQAESSKARLPTLRFRSLPCGVIYNS